MSNAPSIDSKTPQSVLYDILELRAVVAFLGESKQKGWWDCGFLDTTGIRFLETTFPRTAFGASLHSTTEAARAVHDAALGKIGTYHLFRLPPYLEDRLEKTLDDADWEALRQEIASVEAATNLLNRLADAVMINAPQGPVQVGVERKILTHTSIHELAVHYNSAFNQGIRCFPYFAQDNNGI